jgi:predicted phosphodiesterase
MHRLEVKYMMFLSTDRHTHKKEESRIGETVVLNPGTGHKKIKNTSGAFSDGGTMIFNTRINEIACQPLP